MIPRFLRPERVPYARVEIIKAPTQFFVTLRYHTTGHEQTYVETSALNRALLIVATQYSADVVAQGER